MPLSETRLELRARSVGPWPMSAYALVCPTTRQSILIDPGAEPEMLMEMLADSVPVGILLTHSHPDHVGALDEMCARLEVPMMAHLGPHSDETRLAAERWLHDGSSVGVGRHALRVYHTPGHTADAICFALWDDAGRGDHRIIVGDAIFEGGPGKTWSPGGFRTTLQTLQDVILSWPDAAVCYPGHGPAFCLGDKRGRIEAFLRKDHGDFFGDATWDM